MNFSGPTEAELAVVQTIKNKLATEAPDLGFTYTDTTILRFYRGRKNDEEKAYNALIRHVQWREEHKVDQISENQDKFKTELDCKKIAIEGRDLNGRPSLFIYAGKHSKASRDLEEVRMLIIYTLESILKQTKPEEERIVICFDLSGFSYSCMDYEVLQLLVNTMQFNYPETLSVALVINAPFIFSACWAIIKPWLDPVTAAKAMFIQKEQLVDYFHPEIIPSELSAKSVKAEVSGGSWF